MAQLKILSHLLWQQSNCLTHRISRQGRQSMKPWTGPGGAPFSVGLSTGATQNNKCPETRWEDRQSYTYWYVDIVCIIYICIYVYIYNIYILYIYNIILQGHKSRMFWEVGRSPKSNVVVPQEYHPPSHMGSMPLIRPSMVFTNVDRLEQLKLKWPWHVWNERTCIQPN